MTTGRWLGTVTTMDDQDEAWRRLTEARLKALEAAVKPGAILRTRRGRPMPPAAYEPGERTPLTKWLEVRMLAMELLMRLVLDADRYRSEDDLDVPPLEDMLEWELVKLERWARAQVDPDINRRETMAMILLARTILLETHNWPLEELEEDEMWKPE